MNAVVSTHLPSPPYEEAIDLTGLKNFQLPTSMMVRKEMVRAFQEPTLGALLRLTVYSLQEVPAGSLPDDENDLRHLAGMANSSDGEWLKVRAAMKSTWTLCSDGRYYDFALVDPVMSMWRQLTGARRGALRSVESRQQKRAANA